MLFIFILEKSRRKDSLLNLLFCRSCKVDDETASFLLNPKRNNITKYSCFTAKSITFELS